MTVVHEPGDLAQSQLALEQAHLLVGQDIGNGLSATPGAAELEAFARDAGVTPFAIGQQIKAGGEDLLEEFGAVAAAIKNHRESSLAHQRPHLGQDAGQHFDQAGVGLGSNDEQRVAGTIVDPVIRSGWQRDAHARHVGFGQRVLSVIDPHVAVGVEKAQSLAAQGDSLLGQGLAKLRRASHGRQAGQFAPQPCPRR